ncbi:hypothetical protein sos41_41480 [Alphaproteobacteria bacterium SO-S41]|nr:hypothetical protein sos41_41480 [Alphaproteobacteria bacterium SO-S41]
MFAWINHVNDQINSRLDALAVLPLAFVAVLGFFVLATVAFESPAGTLAASHVARFEG